MSAEPPTQLLRLYGLRIDTPVALPGHACERSGPVVGVRVASPTMVRAHEGQVRARCRHDGKTFYEVHDSATGASLVLPGHAVFDLDFSSDVITCRPDERSSVSVFEALLPGTVLALLLSLHGATVLHGSAVTVEGLAYAFVGGSGFGKSTLAALCCAAGASVVSDDVLRCEVTSDGATVHAGSTELRLRRAAWPVIDLFPSPPSQRRTADMREAVAPRACTEELLPLRALFVPRPRRDGRRLMAHPLSPVDAFRRLSTAQRILGWSQPRDLAREFRSASAMSTAVPVFDLDVPWGPPFPATLPSELLETVVEAAQMVHTPQEGEKTNA